MNKIEAQDNGFSGIKNNISKRLSAGILATGLAVTGVGFGGEVEASAETKSSNSSIATLGEMPSQNEGIIEEILNPTPDYTIKQQETDVYKEILKVKECQEIYLDFCADFLYSRNKSDGFKMPGYFDLWQKTILGDYVTDEQIYEFGRTGKGLDVIYFKDKNGKKTKEPAIAYVATPDVKKFKISDIEKGIAFWEKVAPGFLRTMVNNDVRVFFQGQASSNEKIKIFNYEYGIIYDNYSSTDANLFSFLLRRGFALEPFGVRGDALGIFNKNEVAVIKSWLARDCSNYIFEKTKNKDVKNQINEYDADLIRYMSDGGFTYEYMSPIIERIKKEGLMIPFGAETWEEIDSVASPNTN
ncbi:MAG: hypothetical protein PHX84_03030 [Candidatus Shapirobacteria bacterium]|nr:hypothetical protein [Candidatus Shapirobacteria bacterium]